MTKKLPHIIMCLLGLSVSLVVLAVSPPYQDDEEYLSLRTAMHHAFNDGDSASFYPALKNLEDYLLKQNDMHAYYTQRCNEIIFLMNSQKIFEAYKLMRKLSQELREKGLDKEMYMAYNMLGHIYRYCGNDESARRCFWEVIHRMEEAGYRESMPPIYMNLVGLETGNDPQEALRLLDTASTIAAENSPERVFDIETRRTLIHYNLGDTAKFLEGYEAYKRGEAEGFSSVHGRSLEISHLAYLGKFDEAVQMAREELGGEGLSTITELYKDAGRWQEAYEALKRETTANDSLASVILTNSMEGIRDELMVYDAERRANSIRTVTLTIISGLLVMLVLALVYIVMSRRRHIRQLQRAYQHALESDNMKSAFIRNVSHEVRTPLNIISGFGQVIANPDLEISREERMKIAQMMKKNTTLVTSLFDEMLELSHNESSGMAQKDEQINVNKILRDQLQKASALFDQSTTKLQFSSTLPDDYVFSTNTKMLERCVSLLLNNAFKNTPEGTVTLRATLNADDSALQIAVEDTGCGIPEAEAEHIFERFVKLDAFKEGIGLGLPLCRLMAERLGGTVVLDTAYSTQQQGARFVVTLPIAEN